MAAKTNNEDSSKVDAYLAKHSDWQAILKGLRKIILATELEETIKWGAPTYTLNGKNVVSLAGFKNHCALWFHQGAFLKDKNKILVNAQDGKTKGLRQWRFEAGDKINARLVKSYVLEAIDNQRSGKQIKPTQQKLSLPAELNTAMQADQDLKQSFEELTPGKQKEYANHIAEAKREATRQSRLEKCIPMIKSGVGLLDKYRNC